MGKIALQFKATLENVTNLRPLGEDFRWYLKMKCGNCGEISEKWQYIRLMDSVALKGGRGSASMVQKCKLCARENSIEILSSTIKSYNAEDNEKFKTIVEFECRGLEPVDFQPQVRNLYLWGVHIGSHNRTWLHPETRDWDFTSPTKCLLYVGHCAAHVYILLHLSLTVTL